MENIHENYYLLCKPEFSSATKTSFLLKTQKITTLQQITVGSTPNIVRYFVKTLQLKKILQFQERICFFINNTKKQPLKQVSAGETPYLVLKKMLKLFPKTSATQENVRISEPK